MTVSQIKPEEIKERSTISLPYLEDRMIFASIMNRDGISLSAAVRVAAREYARSHDILPESLTTAPTTESTVPPAG